MEFSELALLKLAQLIPEIASYVVSFADITDKTIEQDESSLQIGVFLVRFGNSFYYIPLACKGESIQPIDSLFCVEKQKFIPLTKKIVSNLIDTSTQGFGRSTKIPSTVVTNPSVHHLVTPPRTGKFVYASASRIGEFLNSLPNMTKSAVLNKLSSDKTIYEGLHKLFGLENIFSSLKPTIVAETPSPAPELSILTSGKGLAQEEIDDILEKGYTVRGSQSLPRVAIVAQNFDDMGGFKILSNTDSGKDYTVYSNLGEELTAFIPRKAKQAPEFPALLKSPGKINAEPIFALFRNCDYAITSNLVGKIESETTKSIIKDIISEEDNISISQITIGDSFALFTLDYELIGVFSANNVNHASYGTSVRAYNKITHTTTVISAFRNVTTISSGPGKDLFVPFHTLCIKLNNPLSDSLETNVNSVMRKLDFITKQTLGVSAELGYDGVNYSYNGSPLSNHVDVIKVLVLKEGISPDSAESFVKKAQANGRVKFYMSKLAQFDGPEFYPKGETPSNQYNPLDLQGSDFAGAVQLAVQTQDSETVESAIISELLQTQDMAEHILEYLPDIENAIDKLGRTLFLIRINIGKIGERYEANELLGFVSNLRSVYRLLGENYLKLSQLAQPEPLNAERKT